mmetsp:Transcript_55188/g.145683  ORF Transcript_55188/g.145683 Transcript_55188/m.145683 type:complete len:172 (+) Transcript_55188:734-1249(+)
MDEDTDVLKFNRKPVKVMTAAQFDEKYGARPYLQKNLRDWAFQDVLDFFRRSVTNDRKCIELITTREVDGSIIDKLNDDEEMARTLNMQPIHVRKFRIKMKQVQELFNREGLSLEERELKETLKANKLEHYFNRLTMDMEITSVAKLKDAIDNDTLDTKAGPPRVNAPEWP